MPKAKKPWRTVILSEETGRFTREQIREAVLAVKEERERRGRVDCGEEAVQIEEEDAMPRAKKPWRTLVKGSDTGRFTREQYREAVRAVKEERERRGRADCDEDAAQMEEDAMSNTQKPWRTLAEVPLAGRFTREQWDEAFRALEASKQRKQARASRAKKTVEASELPAPGETAAGHPRRTPRAA